MCRECTFESAAYKSHRDTQPDEPTHYPSKRKDTRKWCKGVKGRVHVPVVMKRQSGYASSLDCRESTWMPDRWMCWHARVCEVCKKVLNFSVECPDKPD